MFREIKYKNREEKTTKKIERHENCNVVVKV